MTFWQKMKAGFQKFMQGRHGADQLSSALIWGGLFLYILALIPALGFLWLIAMAMYVYAIFRMFSRNNEKRWAENAKYVEFSGKVRTNAKQAFVRAKNSGKYKYFRCPKCRAWLRLPRKVGEVTITCGKCGHAMKKKA
ncbi:MAG: hypothetical protein PUD50_04080 [Eubacteriales bacterium]|nr:hypothetical protein [Eubacteriales bacterium]